jgi:hypothetical protein
MYKWTNMAMTRALKMQFANFKVQQVVMLRWILEWINWSDGQDMRYTPHPPSPTFINRCLTQLLSLHRCSTLQRALRMYVWTQMTWVSRRCRTHSTLITWNMVHITRIHTALYFIGKYLSYNRIGCSTWFESLQWNTEVKITDFDRIYHISK